MIAIMKREINSYFNSAIGYVYLTVFYLFSGLQLFGLVSEQSSDLRIIFAGYYGILMLIVPLLTMRLFSDEKKMKTDQALLTSPISVNAVVYGKFIAAMIIFFIGIAITIPYAIVLNIFGDVNWLRFFGNLVGITLLGGAMISIGIFFSSLTESQIIAAITTFGMLFFLLLLEVFSMLINNPLIQTVANGLAFNPKYEEFTFGVFTLAGILFFLSIIAVMNFCTFRVIEKKRWS